MSEQMCWFSDKVHESGNFLFTESFVNTLPACAPRQYKNNGHCLLKTELA